MHCSGYRAQYDVTEFSNCHTEEQREAEFFLQFEKEMVSYRVV